MRALRWLWAPSSPRPSVQLAAVRCHPLDPGAELALPLAAAAVAVGDRQAPGWVHSESLSAK